MLHHHKAVLLLLAVTAACGGDSEQTGASCEVADDCYDIADRDQIVGTIECMDRVPGGYCTHTCTTDGDCCALPGECEETINQVCSPYENDATLRCFLSCEPADIGDLEENAYCQEFAHESFICRSSGAGSGNRKICVPEG